jgi:hypothetical protein
MSCRGTTRRRTAWRTPSWATEDRNNEKATEVSDIVKWLSPPGVTENHDDRNGGLVVCGRWR